MLPDIDFFQIRAFQNSRNKGFEELCVQLFRASLPAKTQFYRVDDAGGDGGVEDIALLDDDKKVDYAEKSPFLVFGFRFLGASKNGSKKFIENCSQLMDMLSPFHNLK